MMDARAKAARELWQRFAPTHHIGWEDETHRAEYLAAIDGISTGLLFNLLLSRINFDGMDPRTFSLAELHGAVNGAEWPEASAVTQQKGGEA